MAPYFIAQSIVCGPFLGHNFTNGNDYQTQSLLLQTMRLLKFNTLCRVITGNQNNSKGKRAPLTNPEDDAHPGV